MTNLVHDDAPLGRLADACRLEARPCADVAAGSAGLASSGMDPPVTRGPWRSHRHRTSASCRRAAGHGDQPATPRLALTPSAEIADEAKKLAWPRLPQGRDAQRSTFQLLAPLSMLLLSLGGCMGDMGRPMPELDRALEQAGNGRSPALGETVLALISGKGGREQVLLVDLRSRLPIPVPGLNRPDAQPLSVATDARGERLALVRHRQGRTELVLYRRNLASLEPIPLQPDGVPRQVALDPEGRSLAVEVSRDGLWQLDLITLP